MRLIQEIYGITAEYFQVSLVSYKKTLVVNWILTDRKIVFLC